VSGAINVRSMLGLDEFRPFGRAFRASISSLIFIFSIVVIALIAIVLYIAQQLLADQTVNFTKSFLGNPQIERDIVGLLKIAVQYPLPVGMGLMFLVVAATAVVSARNSEKYQSEIGDTDLSTARTAEDLRPNLLCGECGTRRVTLGRNDHWIYANYPLDEPVQTALVARFSNLAKSHKRVGRANSLRARISYVPQHQDDDTLELRRGFAVDPATWLERRPPFILNVGETAELIVALITDAMDRKSGETVAKFRVVEDRGLKASDKDHRYTYGPLMDGNVVATVTLTANGMSAGRFKFLLTLGPPLKIEPLKFQKRGLFSRFRNTEWA
jgi:hypothetical protein